VLTVITVMAGSHWAVGECGQIDNEHILSGSGGVVINLRVISLAVSGVLAFVHLKRGWNVRHASRVHNKTKPTILDWTDLFTAFRVKLGNFSCRALTAGAAAARATKREMKAAFVNMLMLVMVRSRERV
jgi:hypothetical protein